MGWTYQEKPRSVKDHFKKQLEWEDGKMTRCVLDSAIVGLKTYYAALEYVHNDSGEREVVAIVSMINFVPRARDGFTFGYKDMDETWGPYQYDCPEKILDLLTPTTNTNALEWRSKCRAQIERRKVLQGIEVGTVLRFEAPVHFIDGNDYLELVVTKCTPSNFQLKPLANPYLRYRISRTFLLERKFKQVDYKTAA